VAQNGTGYGVLHFDRLIPKGIRSSAGLDESTARMTLCSLHSLIHPSLRSKMALYG